MNNYRDRETIRGGIRQQALSGVAAAAALGNRMGAADVLKISRMLNNSDAMVREKTVRTLGDIGGMEAIRYISKATNDNDPRVRAEACKVLGRLRAHSAKAELYDALHDRDATVVCSAAGALGAMGDQKGRAIVEKLILTPGRHQWTALRSFNVITNQDFRINDHGLTEAVRYIKAKKKRFFGFGR